MQTPVVKLLQNIIAENPNPEIWYQLLKSSVLAQTQAHFTEVKYDVAVPPVNCIDILNHLFPNKPYEFRIIHEVSTSMYVFGYSDKRSNEFTYLDIRVDKTVPDDCSFTIRVVSDDPSTISKLYVNRKK